MLLPVSATALKSVFSDEAEEEEREKKGLFCRRVHSGVLLVILREIQKAKLAPHTVRTTPPADLFSVIVCPSPQN